MTPADKRILRQFSKKLLQPSAYLCALADGQFGLYREGQKKPQAHARIEAAHISAWRRADLLQGEEKISLSPTGRAFLRRQLSGKSDERFLAQHKAIQGVATGDRIVRRAQGTPLQWLKARKQAKGYGLQALDFEAGEALMRDYDRAAFHPRQTMNWQRSVFVDSSTHVAPDAPAHVLDARRKLQAALDYAGPGLAEIALAVCCSEIGLEECERGFDLPKRSGKLMLKMALTRLSVFYGLQSAAMAAASLRMR